MQLAANIAESSTEAQQDSIMSDGRKIQWSPNAKAAVGKLVVAQLETMALDLEAFAKHARRMTINCEDVKLAFRRNPELVEMLKRYIDGRPTTKRNQDQAES